LLTLSLVNLFIASTKKVGKSQNNDLESLVQQKYTYMMDMLDYNDDVKDVYHNAEIPEEE
jgi:transcriptional/translational regulatory protein YebC/TACO1